MARFPSFCSTSRFSRPGQSLSSLETEQYAAHSRIIVALWTITTQAQFFDPNGVKSDQRFDPAKVGTDKTTNTTYSNPIMTVNTGDPCVLRLCDETG